MPATLIRETAREEYFYQQGRLEAFQEAGSEAAVRVYSSVVANALAQIEPERARYYDE